MCCSVLQCAAVCCSVLQCVLQFVAVTTRESAYNICMVMSCSVLQRDTRESVTCVAVCCSVLQCVAVCCSVLQCVAVQHMYVHVLQCVAV